VYFVPGVYGFLPYDRKLSGVFVRFRAPAAC
jgi:hypothetical protein